MRFWRCRRKANVSEIQWAVWTLTAITRKIKVKGVVAMTNPVVPDPTNPADQVSVSQSWLDYVGSTVGTANSVLGPYIQQLIAGESVQLAPADVDAVTSALAGLVAVEPTTPTS